MALNNLNSLLGFGLLSFGMKKYQKILRTQNIEVKYANSYRLRLQSNRWKNPAIHAYMVEQLQEKSTIKKVEGSPQIGSLLFVFTQESFTQTEFQQFLAELVAVTDQAYQKAPVTVLNRLYDGKLKANDLLKRGTLGLVDVDTALFGYTTFQAIKMFNSAPHTALSFLWWSYSILERANKKR